MRIRKLGIIRIIPSLLVNPLMPGGKAHTCLKKPAAKSCKFV